jgi:hypothetical protein
MLHFRLRLGLFRWQLCAALMFSAWWCRVVFGKGWWSPVFWPPWLSGAGAAASDDNEVRLNRP